MCVNTRIAVIGGGSWGTAFAKVCADSGYETMLYVRNHQLAQQINSMHTNSYYLPDIQLPDNLIAYSDDIRSVFTCHQQSSRPISIVFIGVPTQNVRQCMETLPQFPLDFPIISLAKGIDCSNLLRMSEVITSCQPQVRVGVISGPNLAREVAQNMPTSASLALSAGKHNNKNLDIQEDSSTNNIVDAIVKQFAKNNFSLWLTNDVIGVEIAGAFKNIVALACGMAVGLGYRDNTVAALITVGFAEMRKLIFALGGKEETLFSPAGLGDLAATCYSDSSRNHSYGVKLATMGKRHVQSGDSLSANAEALVEIPDFFDSHDPYYQLSPHIPNSELGKEPWVIPHQGAIQVVEAIPTLVGLSQLARKNNTPITFINIIIDILEKKLSVELGILQLVSLAEKYS